jgi:hypothetical protein
MSGRDITRHKLRDARRPIVSRPYKILTPGRPIRNRKLTRLGARKPVGKEAIMLDVAFVALGLAALAPMDKRADDAYE